MSSGIGGWRLATGSVDRSRPILEVRRGTKLYKGTAAIRDVDFVLRPGEVHAMVGENGAGKSTVCKVIAGVIRLDEGELRVEDRPVHFRAPRDALASGIAMVYQETSLVPTMTVAQNIELGHESLFTRYRTLNIGAQQLLQSMSFQVDPATYVSALGAAKKQMVEIARALRSSARVILFDEPTASLTPEEKQHLFDVIRGLRDAGVGVVFVSHALEESLEIADRITVLRDGEVRLAEETKGLGRDDLVRAMVGRSVEYARTGRTRPGPKKQVLRVENVTMGTIVKNMSLTAYAGEVLGIAGLVGSGRTETAMIVAGALKRNRIHGGEVRLEDRPVRYRVPGQAIDDGIAYVTEDRKRNGFFETMTVEENIHLGRLATRAGRRWLVSRRERGEVARELTERLSVRGAGKDTTVVELSGGNQQKVVIAKALVQDPRVVILDEPTRGVDVGAIAEIHEIIRSLADAGKAVIVISSYLPEILAVSDRILVARQGRIVAEFSPEEATEEKILYAAVH